MDSPDVSVVMLIIITLRVRKVLLNKRGLGSIQGHNSKVLAMTGAINLIVNHTTTNELIHSYIVISSVDLFIFY